MSDNKFNHGDFVVPDDDMTRLFVYDQVNTELDEFTEYRLATSAEIIYARKYLTMSFVDKGLDTYKKSQHDKVGKVYASIEKEKNNYTKQGKS